jgi:hypothetical protein
MSKLMNPVEWNYGIPDKEALAIVKGLQNWRHWLIKFFSLVSFGADRSFSGAATFAGAAVEAALLALGAPQPGNTMKG